MVASNTSRQSAAPTLAQRLDHLHPPAVPGAEKLPDLHKVWTSHFIKPQNIEQSRSPVGISHS
jgi:hypothetical protein